VRTAAIIHIPGTDGADAARTFGIISADDDYHSPAGLAALARTSLVPMKTYRVRVKVPRRPNRAITAADVSASVNTLQNSYNLLQVLKHRMQHQRSPHMRTWCMYAQIHLLWHEPSFIQPVEESAAAAIANTITATPPTTPLSAITPGRNIRMVRLEFQKSCLLTNAVAAAASSAMYACCI
jgi:hypothetical protein